jgi:hypothetical protein
MSRRSAVSHRRLATVAAQVSAQPVAPGTNSNAPRGEHLQGFGRLATAQPPVFDPTVDFEPAYQFFQENSFVAVKAFSLAEVDQLNEEADRWTREYSAQPDTELLFWPLVDYPVVDPFVRHQNIFPFVQRALGGAEKVRFQQCNWRQYPVGYGARRGADGLPPPSSHTMHFHADSNLPDRHTRQPYWPGLLTQAGPGGPTGPLGTPSRTPWNLSR